MTYPPEQYREPIWMVPASFQWKARKDAQGIYVKQLGVFSNGGVVIEMLRGDAGSKYLQGDNGRRQILFVEQGLVENDQTMLGTHSAVYTTEIDTVSFTAVTAWQGVLIALPSFTTP